MSETAYDPQNIFGKILRGEVPCHKVYEDEHALAFLDIFPRAEGHTLVIPRVAARGLLDMPTETLGPYMQRVQKVAAGVKSALGADGLTIQQFNEYARAGTDPEFGRDESDRRHQHAGVLEHEPVGIAFVLGREIIKASGQDAQGLRGLALTGTATAAGDQGGDEGEKNEDGE